MSDELKIDEFQVTLSQPVDSCGRANDDSNIIIVSTADAGAGKYFVIQTDRWTFDDASELVAMLDRVKAALQAIGDSDE